MSWHYNDGGKAAGPVADDEFEKLVASGKIQPQTLVWREGMASWQPFSAMSPGAAVVAASRVCCECGKSFPEDEVIRFNATWVCATCKPVFFQRLREGATSALVMEYGGFWLRFLAKMVDTIILSMAGFVMGLVVGGIMATRTGKELGWAYILMQVFLMLFGMVTSAAYTIGFVGKFGATPGKMACGLKIVRPDGRPLTYGRACGRFFAEWLSGMTLYVGYIMVGFDREKRALHDHICDTRVVRSRS